MERVRRVELPTLCLASTAAKKTPHDRAAYMYGIFLCMASAYALNWLITTFPIHPKETRNIPEKPKGFG
jgi:hypothetical protein